MLHLRADTGIELSASGHVTKWKDLSPRQAVYQAAKGDTTYRPTVVADGIGGYPAVRFSGSQALQDSSSLPLDSGCTILIVAQDSSGKDAETGLLDKGYEDLALALWGGSVGNLTFSYSYKATLAHSSLDTSAPTLFESSWGDSIAKLYANGKLLDSEHQSYILDSSYRKKVTTLGGAVNNYGTLDNFLKGRIAEVRVYAGVLTDSLRMSIEDSLLKRYQVAQPPHLILHLRADTGVEHSASGLVSKWKDLSARHTDFAPASGDTLQRPALDSHGIGNKASIHFSGSQALQDTSSLPLDSGCTILIVAQDSSGKGALTGLLDKGADDYALALWGGTAGNVTFSLSWEQTIAHSQLDTAAPMLYEATSDGNLAKIFANGTLLDSAFRITSSSYNIPQRNKVTTLGASLNASGTILGYFLKGEISEVRVYSGVLPDSLRKVVEDSLIARYIDTTKSPSAIAAHSRLSSLPRLSQLHDGNLLIEGTTPLGLFGIDGRAIRFTSTQAQGGMLLKPSKSLAPGQYLLPTKNGTVRFVVMRP